VLMAAHGMLLEGIISPGPRWSAMQQFVFAGQNHGHWPGQLLVDWERLK